MIGDQGPGVKGCLEVRMGLRYVFTSVVGGIQLVLGSMLNGAGTVV